MINLKLAEKFFIVTLGLSVIISVICKSFINLDHLSNLLIGFNILFFTGLLTLGVVKNMNAKILIFIFFFLRLLLLYFDYYGQKLGTVLHSGGDSENFYQWAVYISEDLKRIKEISYTKYTDFLGILYAIIGDQRLYSQFINVLLGMWSIFVFYKTLELFKLKDSQKLFFLALYGFYPQNVIFSSILLREALIHFFFIYSLYFFIQWLRSNDKYYIIKTILFALLCTVFHTGMVLSLLFYCCVFLFFDAHKTKFNFSLKRKIILIVFCSLTFIIIKFNLSFVSNKLAFLLTDDSLSFAEKLKTKSAEAGGATYLRNFEVNSFLDFILLMPLRLVYFILSPMPYDVRGIGDLLAILLDSSFYYYLIYTIVKSRKFLKKNILGIFPKIFLILFLLISTGFAFGTENSGTAMRHRSKIFPALVIIVVFTTTLRQNKTAIWNVKETH